MKKSLTLTLTLVALAVFPGLSAGQSTEQKNKQQTSSETPRTIGEKTYGPSPTGQIAVAPGADTKKLVAEAIASTIVTLKGKAFPLVAKGSGSDAVAIGGASCELYGTQTFTHAAAIDLESPYHVKKTNTYPSAPPQEAIYSPPNADWVVQSYNRVITSTGPPYVAADSAFPAGYTFLTNSNYSSVSSTMHSFVGSLNVNGKLKADLNAKLDTFISNISAYSYSLSGSHGTVRHTATVWGTGVFNTQQGHSWYHAYINGTLVCAPAYLRDQNALIARLKTWVKSVIGKLPSSLTYETSKQ
jgi:hypothetical protein